MGLTIDATAFSMRIFHHTIFFAILARSIAAPPPRITRESITPPHGWVKHGDPHPERIVSIRIGLPQAGFENLETRLFDASTPGHHLYGKHLSKEEVESLVAPRPQSIDAVTGWLSSHGVPLDNLTFSPAKDWIKARVSISLVEQMLDTKYHVWRDTESGTQILRTTRWSLPADMDPHIEIVQPATSFVRFARMTPRLYWPAEDNSVGPITRAKAPRELQATPNCDFNRVNLSCIAQLYNYDDYMPTNRRNSIGVPGFLDQLPTFQDLQSFFADQRPDITDPTFGSVSINGGAIAQNESLATSEANLDIQWVLGIAHPAKVTFLSTGGQPPFIPDMQSGDINSNEPYMEWLDYMLSQKHLPHVISTSYADREQTVPRDYARRVCRQLAQLSARGVSLIFGSGDNGVGDGEENPDVHLCFSNDGKNKTMFLPEFPASCPYVTTIGATDGFPQVAASLDISGFFSGGGFSNYFERPKYQDHAVKKYLDGLLPGTYGDLFNRKGRAYPDISAHGNNLKFWTNGRLFLAGGTSASTPIVAGIVALLNDARLNAGKKPLGFLNPLLYSKNAAAALNDITEGHNSGCGTTGFNCTTGWDPVTGLGTINFRKLKKIVMRY